VDRRPPGRRHRRDLGVAVRRGAEGGHQGHPGASVRRRRDVQGDDHHLVERPAGTGSAVVRLDAPDNPYLATLGLRVEPAPPGSGLEVRLEAELRTLPMYVYKTVDDFVAMMTEYIRAALREGVRG